MREKQNINEATTDHVDAKPEGEQFSLAEIRDLEEELLQFSVTPEGQGHNQTDRSVQRTGEAQVKSVAKDTDRIDTPVPQAFTEKVNFVDRVNSVVPGAISGAFKDTGKTINRINSAVPGAISGAFRDTGKTIDRFNSVVPGAISDAFTNAFRFITFRGRKK